MQGHSFDPWLGDNDPHAVQCGLKQKRVLDILFFITLQSIVHYLGKSFFLTDISFVCVCVYMYILFQMDKYKEKS